MSKDKKHYTIFTEGSTRTNGVNTKPIPPKPNVQPSGQQSSSKNNGNETSSSKPK